MTAHDLALETSWGGHRPPLQSLKHELESQLHNPWILRRQDFSKVLVVDCRKSRSRNSSTITIRQVECLHASFNTHILLNAEDSRQSRSNVPKARPWKTGPPGIAKRARRGLRECRAIEPAAGIRVRTQRVREHPIRPLGTAGRARQLDVDACSRRHESARENAPTRRESPIRGNRIQPAIGKVR